MGDRGNIAIQYETYNAATGKWDGESTIYLYTHWKGFDLPFILKNSLSKKWRWDDPAYLARIIFCDMIKGFEGDETGFGIAPYVCDENYPTIFVNVAKKTVTILNRSWSFSEYIEALDKEQLSTIILNVYHR